MEEKVNFFLCRQIHNKYESNLQCTKNKNKQKLLKKLICTNLYVSDVTTRFSFYKKVVYKKVLVENF